eukprot:7215941-Prymnesium_polylepis.2
MRHKERPPLATRLLAPVGLAQEAAHRCGHALEVVRPVVGLAESLPRDQLGPEQPLDVAERCLAQEGEIGHHAEQRHAPPLFDGTPKVISNHVDLVGDNLVDHDAAQPHAALLENCTVHLELIEG